MFQSSRRLVPAIAALGCGALALAAEPSVEQLQAKVDAMQAKIEAMEARQTSAADVDATVARVIEDAQKRSQLMAVEGFTGGYQKDRGFVLKDTEGNFLLHPYLQVQVRNASTWRENYGTGDDTDFQNGFEVRRMKFGFEGNAYSPDLTYQFQWKTDQNSTPTGGGVFLEDAWARYKFDKNMSVMAGQFKDPLFRESLVSSTRQLAADRSLQNYLMEGQDDYVQGISLIYDNGDRMRAQFAYTDGFNSANQSFVQDNQVSSTTGTQYASGRTYVTGVAARGEYMVMGDPAKTWKQYSGFSAQGASSDMLILGAAGDWSQNGDLNATHYTVDAQWQPEAIAGLSVYGGLVGVYSSGNGAPSANTWGGIVQVGYMVTPRIEPFARYDYTRCDQNTLSNANEALFGTRNVQEATIGVNYYLFGQNAKFTLDLSYLPEGYFGTDATGADVLQQMGENEWVARAQFQLVI